MAYTLLLQNLASKSEFIITGLVDVSPSRLSYVFENFEMPDGAEQGEYSCFLFKDNRNDCVYKLTDDILRSTVETAEGTVQIFRLRPEVFLLRYGEYGVETLEHNHNENYFYYEG